MKKFTFEEHQASVREERKQLAESYDAETFDMDEHLANHPITKLMQAGVLKLRSDHPTQVLKRRRELERKLKPEQ